MAVKISRLDDRLIHGQVVTSWLTSFGIQQIIIVSSRVAGDEVQEAVLKMSVPGDTKLRIFTPERFLEIALNKPINRETLLLFDSVYDIEKVVQGGYHLEKLNIGGLRLIEGRTQLTKQLSVTEEERACFKRLLEKGVDIEIRMVPSDQKIMLKEVI